MSACAKCRDDFTHISGPNICPNCLGVSQVKYQNPTLNERESTHGDYEVTAKIAQELKMIIGEALTNNPTGANDVIHESLDLICTKIARICSGDPYEIDHYRDIAGYANLVSERLERD